MTLTPDPAKPNPLVGDDRERFGGHPLETFRNNLDRVRERMAIAARRAGRDPGSVRLQPVTKTVPADVLRHAFAAGMDAFAENKIQEARAKQEALADLPLRWSIVGHLQTNKAKYLARFADEFQALDSLRVAAGLQTRLEREGRRLDVFVQVNTSGETSKYGLRPDDLPRFLDELQQFDRLVPRGLMTLAVFSADMEQVRPSFRLLRSLRDISVRRHPEAHRLSMGMSGDYEAAIEEGADVVRVGQAIFGKRPHADSYYWPGAAGAG